MKLTPEQLAGHLKSSPLPCYLVSGDEPLIREECSDQIRLCLRTAGFADREVLQAESGFKWEYLLECANALSLFADKKLLELRLGSQKVNKDASTILLEYLTHAPAENALLITAGKLDGGTKKSAWYKKLEQTGAVIEVWPIEANQLPGWIRHRATQIGLVLDNSAVDLLCDRVEGNLLAAKQELDKLHLLYPNHQITAEEVIEAVSDSSRYDVFGLLDAIALGRADRCLKILNVLQQEGTEPPIVLWALAREIRTLYAVINGLEQGKSYDSLCQQERIWGKRRKILRQCANRLSKDNLYALLNQSHHLDKVIKGAGAGSAWLMLTDITLALAGSPIRLPDC